MKIGFIGLGIMGSRMAANLQAAGHSLIVYNRDSQKAVPLVKAGAKQAASVKELAGSAELIVSMLADPVAVTAISQGKEGLFEVAGAQKVWLDCSTLNPSFSQEMAAKAAVAGYRYLDAPVAGSKIPAAHGELVFMVGGAETAVARCTPLLEIMGKKTIYAGASGQGAALKMIINLLLAQSMFAFSEGMALGQGLGLPKDILLNVLLNLPVTAPFLAALRPMLESGDYEANFPLRHMRKDLQLVALSAYEQEVALPTTQIIKEHYTLAMQQGMADLDFSAIYTLLNPPANQA